MPSLHAEPLQTNTTAGGSPHLPRPPPTAGPEPRLIQQQRLMSAPQGKRGVELTAKPVSFPVAVPSDGAGQPLRRASHISKSAAPFRPSYRAVVGDGSHVKDVAAAGGRGSSFRRPQSHAVSTARNVTAGGGPQRARTAKGLEVAALMEAASLTAGTESRGRGANTIGLTSLKSTVAGTSPYGGLSLASPPAPPVTSPATAAANLIPSGSWSRTAAVSCRAQNGIYDPDAQRMFPPPALSAQPLSVVPVPRADVTCKELVDLAAENVASLSIKERGALPLYSNEQPARNRYAKRCPSPPPPTEGIIVPPLTSHGALNLYQDRLTAFEQEEIFEYSQIYFVGRSSAPKRSPGIPTTSGSSSAFPNVPHKAAADDLGFDDDRGDFYIVIGDHLCYRYEVMDTLGKGSFGQVVKVFDHATGLFQAVKIIRNRKRFHNQALVEVKVLDCVNSWDLHDVHHIVRKTAHFYFRGHLCIAFELLSMNLYEFIKSNSFQGSSLSLIRRFATQLLESLCLLSEKSVVHCDLKPENILLKNSSKSSIKLIDFGSSCFENERVYTYIQSRFYRSPEVILEIPYSSAIDMWSLGCILAELYTGYPLFPGESEEEQLACIIEVVGPPSQHIIDQSARKSIISDSAGLGRPVVNSKGRVRRPFGRPLHTVLKSAEEVFVDFIARCLSWDPERRMKPKEALKHPWIREPSSGRSTTGHQSSIPACIPGRRSTVTDAGVNALSASTAAPLPTAQGGFQARRRDRNSTHQPHHHSHPHHQQHYNHHSQTRGQRHRSLQPPEVSYAAANAGHIARVAGTPQQQQQRQTHPLPAPPKTSSFTSNVLPPIFRSKQQTSSPARSANSAGSSGSGGLRHLTGLLPSTSGLAGVVVGKKPGSAKEGSGSGDTLTAFFRRK